MGWCPFRTIYGAWVLQTLGAPDLQLQACHFCFVPSRNFSRGWLEKNPPLHGKYGWFSSKPSHGINSLKTHRFCNPIYSNSDCESWLVTLYFWLNHVKSPFCMFLFVPLFAQTYRSPKPRFTHVKPRFFLSWLIYTNWALALPKTSFYLANHFPQYWIATPI